MSWNDFYRRRDAIQAALRWAERNPGQPLCTSATPLTDEVFVDIDELLGALHHRWMLQLSARVELTLAEAECDPSTDRVDAVAAAWRALAADEHVLRGVLDTHAGHQALRELTAREQHMLALAAGLADLSEPAEEITRIGAAFMTLVRGARQPESRRANPVEQFLRRLLPSA